MRKRTLVITIVISLPLLLLAARWIGAAESHQAEAGGAPPPPVQEGPANVELTGSSQTWTIVSKADFIADRVIVKVGKPDQDQKVLEAHFTCGGETVAGEQKPSEKEANPGTSLPNHEVWSATFSDKCVGKPNVPVSVTLVPVDPHNKLVIKEASVQNTTTLVPQESPINAARIHGNSLLWKITPKQSAKRFNRVDVEIGRPGNDRVVLLTIFACQHPFQIKFGELKTVVNNAQPGTLPNHEVWSADFRRKCSEGVTALIIPRHPRIRIVIKGGSVSNTSHLVPIEAPANVVLKGKSQTFKVTSKATFAANRVEVDVGTPAAAVQKVKSASFVCDGDKVEGKLKRIEVNPNPNDTVHPIDEIWSADFPTKCIGIDGSVSVTIVPRDPNNQIEIKKARVQNTTPPTDTPTPTPASIPTPTGTNGSCVAVALGQPFPHRPDQPLWDFWTCTPSQNVDWNRVDILIGRPSQEPKVKAVQFDCTSNHSKASTIALKGHVKTATQDMELWSGEGFKEVLPGGSVLVKNCHGAVSVAIAMFDPTNHPQIKKAFFSHTGLPKPTPAKPASNGNCVATAADQWTCTPDDGVPPFNRIDIKVASPTDALQIARMEATCPIGSATPPAAFDLKGQKVFTDNNGNASRHEVWSASFRNKCQGDVSVALLPFAAGTTPQIIGVTFSNTTPPTPTPPPKPDANGRCTLIDNIHQWSCVPNALSQQFTRVDISVGKTAANQPKLTGAIFVCLSTNEQKTGVFKRQKPNDSAAFSLSDVWSADFVQPCTGEIRVFLVEVSATNLPQIKKVVFGSSVG